MIDRQTSISGASGVVCSVDHRASAAGIEILGQGGNAVDAAIATNAALAVTTQHSCGLGGDLFALVYHGEATPDCLNASGRAGSGADPERLRAEGHSVMPFREDIRSVPVPGCVDGWMALHERHGMLPVAALLAPAIDLASGGFTIPDHLAISSERVAGIPGADDYQNLVVGETLRRPEVASALTTICESGRDGWYGGEFGAALLEIGNGEYIEEDLARSQADWVEPLHTEAWGHHLWTTPPNSQGYLSLAAARILHGLELPPSEDALWAHLHVEAARLAAYDRLDELHEHADGAALITEERLASRRALLNPDHRSEVPGRFGDGGTIYMCTTDADGMGVSLIQSNASGFGAHIVAPGTGVFLHNRGIGFTLEKNHPAEYGPGRRPTHTLAPALVTNLDGSLRTVLGTMGGDAQPQIVLQMLSRLLVGGLSPAEVLSRPRWVLESVESDGFNTWRDVDNVVVVIESGGEDWVEGLMQRGHRAECRDVSKGHAHLIDIDSDGVHHGAAEPRVSTAASFTLDQSE
jgi:gamma-glutamyltranspeptidase/glutathione hydrolase